MEISWLFSEGGAVSLSSFFYHGMYKKVAGTKPGAFMAHD